MKKVLILSGLAPFLSEKLSLSGSFHHHRVERQLWVHTLGEDDVKYGVHTFAFFDGDVNNLRDFAFKNVSVTVVDND